MIQINNLCSDYFLKILKYLKEKKDEHIKEEVGVLPTFKPSKYTFNLRF